MCYILSTHVTFNIYYTYETGKHHLIYLYISLLTHTYTLLTHTIIHTPNTTNRLIHIAKGLVEALLGQARQAVGQGAVRDEG